MVTALDDLRSCRNAILAAASRRGARSVRVFGSVAHGDATAASDVDLQERDGHILAEAVPL